MSCQLCVQDDTCETRFSHIYNEIIYCRNTINSTFGHQYTDNIRTLHNITTKIISAIDAWQSVDIECKKLLLAGLIALRYNLTYVGCNQIQYFRVLDIIEKGPCDDPFINLGNKILNDCNKLMKNIDDSWNIPIGGNVHADKMDAFIFDIFNQLAAISLEPTSTLA